MHFSIDDSHVKHGDSHFLHPLFPSEMNPSEQMMQFEGDPEHVLHIESH